MGKGVQVEVTYFYLEESDIASLSRGVLQMILRKRCSGRRMEKLRPASLMG